MTSERTAPLIGYQGCEVRLSYNVPLLGAFQPLGKVLSIKSGCIAIFKGIFDHVVEAKLFDSSRNILILLRRMLWRV